MVLACAEFPNDWDGLTVFDAFDALAVLLDDRARLIRGHHRDLREADREATRAVREAHADGWREGAAEERW